MDRYSSSFSLPLPQNSQTCAQDVLGTWQVLSGDSLLCEHLADFSCKDPSQSREI